MSDKPYAQSCDQNCAPILEILKLYLSTSKSLLEIGSGTGQHALYFAKNFPNLIWHSSDQQQYHEGINLWLAEANADNIIAPIALNVNQKEWPEQRFDAIFTANSLHIMSWSSVQALFSKITDVLAEDALFIVYGPFNYNGQYTSESNQQFDQWLAQQHPESAIRDFEALQKLAKNAHLNLINDHQMPANNRVLVWQKSI